MTSSVPSAPCPASRRRMASGASRPTATSGRVVSAAAAALRTSSAPTPCPARDRQREPRRHGRRDGARRPGEERGDAQRGVQRGDVLARAVAERRQPHRQRQAGLAEERDHPGGDGLAIDRAAAGQRLAHGPATQRAPGDDRPGAGRGPQRHGRRGEHEQHVAPAGARQPRSRRAASKAGTTPWTTAERPMCPKPRSSAPSTTSTAHAAAASEAQRGGDGDGRRVGVRDEDEDEHRQARRRAPAPSAGAPDAAARARGGRRLGWRSPRAEGAADRRRSAARPTRTTRGSRARRTARRRPPRTGR